MKILFKLMSVLMFLFVASIGFEANADDSIGRVVKVRGEVIRDNPERGKGGVITNGAKLYRGDELVSRSRSFIKVLMKDDSIFQLGPNSKFIFEKFEMKTKNERSATYKLVSGKLRSLITKKAPGKTLKIKTPNAAMGIRGTEILSDVYNFNGKSRTDIALMSGKLEVTAIGGVRDGQTFNLKPGDLFETKPFEIGNKGKAIEIGRPQLRRLPKKMFKRLKKSQKNGGETFLFDAKVKENPKLQEKAIFKSSKNSARPEKPNQAPKDLERKVMQGKIDEIRRAQGIDRFDSNKGPGGSNRDMKPEDMSPEQRQAMERRDESRRKIQQQRMQGEMNSRQREQAVKSAQMNQQKQLIEKKKHLLMKKHKEKILQDRINAGLPVPCHIKPSQPHCQTSNGTNGGGGANGEP